MIEKKDFYESLGMKIREIREERGYKKRNDFCLRLVDEGLDIRDDTYGKYENGSRPIPAYILAIAAKVLKVKIDDIIPH